MAYALRGNGIKLLTRGLLRAILTRLSRLTMLKNEY